MKNDELILQILAFTITLISAGATLGVGFAKTLIFKVEILAGITCITAISAIVTIRRVTRTFVMSIYLRKKIEEELPNIKWETDLDKYRTAKKSNRKLTDFMQAGVLIIYQFILASTFIFTYYFTFLLCIQTLGGGDFDITNFDDVKLVIAVLSLLTSYVFTVIVFNNIIKLRGEVNGGIEELWDTVIKKNNPNFHI